MNQTALLFPGQASQYVGMGKDLYETYPRAKELYERANSILGTDIARLSFDGPADDLVQTVNTQPAIYVHSCIAFDLALERGLEFAIAAGHSLGEYSALYACGVLSYDDGLVAVRDRARFMQEACTAHPSTMAAILGLNFDQVVDVCKRASAKGVVVAANYNAAAQVVISGDGEGIAEAIAIAKAAGAKRAVPLAVGGAFHSPLMEPSPAQLKAVLEELTFNDADHPIVLNVTAQPVTSGAEIRKRLIEQLTAPVLWYPTMQHLAEANVARVVELGPKKVLLGLTKNVLKTDDKLSVDTVADVEAIGAVFAKAALS